MLKKITVLLLIIFAFKGCTRDDICSEGTATTPLLIITFKDILNPTNSKKVVKLSIETDYINPVSILPQTDTDSIAIPLSTTSDTSKFSFIKRINDTVVNVDKLMFLYTRNNSYVNRACGYKAEYDNLVESLENEAGGNWILNVQVKRDTVKDENEAHVTILH